MVKERRKCIKKIFECVYIHKIFEEPKDMFTKLNWSQANRLLQIIDIYK